MRGCEGLIAGLYVIGLCVAIWFAPDTDNKSVLIWGNLPWVVLLGAWLYSRLFERR